MINVNYIDLFEDSLEENHTLLLRDNYEDEIDNDDQQCAYHLYDSTNSNNNKNYESSNLKQLNYLSLPDDRLKACVIF